MGDAGDEGGWHLVSHHPATNIREEKQLEEWEKSKGHWSGVGKHPTNLDASLIKALRVQDRELGAGSYGIVERCTFKTVTLARKHVKPRRGITLEKLREEANVMERLVHKHILKLVGTYTPKRNELCILLYPAACCDLGDFLQDIDDIRTGLYADQEDAYKRLHALGLQDVGTIEDLAVLRNPPQSDNSIPRTATAVGFLQQIMGCITEALMYVHEKGIRHRDLKPKNILLSPGRVFLADFGIARDVRESEDSITVGRAGTPSWIAPEVHDMQEHHMGSADIWSLGCIFLTIATLMYGQTLDQCEMITKERSWKNKYEMLPKYLMELRAKAIAASLENHDEPTFNVKHIIGLIEDMLKYEPEGRPSAQVVNERLLEIGGLDQLYHLTCCHKKNDSIAKIINKKLQSVWDSHANSASEIRRLKLENEEKQKRIDELESISGTWQQRLDKERNHAGNQYRALQEKYNKELEGRKALEERLKSFEMRPPRRPRSQNRGRGRGHPGFLHIHGHPALPVNNRFPNPPVNVATGNLPRRSSGIPQPIRPSTPLRPAREKSGTNSTIRPSTPIRPNLSREPGSNTSTLVSSVHSTFSRRSDRTIDSASSVSSATIRSTSPDSPTTTKPNVAPLLELTTPASPTPVHARPNPDMKLGHAAKPSWANMVARSVSSVI